MTKGCLPLRVTTGLCLFLTLTLPGMAAAQDELRDYRVQDLLSCSLTSYEISLLGPDDVLEPCLIYNIRPVSGAGASALENNSTSLIPLVQVTPSNCGNGRDGAVTAVQKLNADSGGQGVAIGFYQDHFVQFTLTSVIAGNPAALSEEEYNRRHDQLLRSLLETTGAPYIIGSCSFASEVEKGPANDYQAIVLTQVGPPGFYLPENSNPYVFGFHIDSDTYPLPNVQSLDFLAVEPFKIPIRVIYRNKSEFFYSTCQSAIDRLTDLGFTDLKAILYDHSGDEDGDGDINQFDVDFLQGLADEACPFHMTHAADEEFHPAIFVCTLTEHDILLARWLETGCRPMSLWVTASTWGWADTHPDQIPYFQGGGQWHENFDYNDAYFASGKQLLQANQAVFGYLGNYDQVVSYAIPVLFAQHLQAAYRVTDVPTPLEDFADPDGRERLRRAMLVLNVETIFGPVAFNENQRNIGRGAAGTQWLPMDETDPAVFRNALVSPFLQAEASTVVPAASAMPCVAGSFANSTARNESGSILSNGCMACPVDTYTLEPSQVSECMICPGESGTDGLVGSDQCFVYEDNLLSPGILALGYVASAITYILAIGFMLWMIWNRNDPVVKVSQVEFLALICIGAMISSTTVIVLSLQAGLGEDTAAASAGCMAAPFLYSIGWVLQYSSLSAKTYRLYQTMMSTKRMKRVTVTALHTLPIVVICLLVDVVIVTVWTVKSPLVYERVETGREIDEEDGIVTISTVGRCVSSDGQFWQYAGPLLGFHVLLVVVTNFVLCNVRDIADRYQEQKYVAMASALMLEILVVGIPVLVSVNDSAEATFIVLTAIIALDDIAILCCIFGPKIQFQRKGLQEGVQFGESIMRESHKRASMREYSRRSFLSHNSAAANAYESSGGHSPEQQNSSNKAESFTDSDDDQRSNSKKRRDSFTNRITAGDSNKPFWSRHTDSSAVESIAEETSEDLLKELGDSGRRSDDSSSFDRQNKQSQRSSNGYMMTPAGMVDAQKYATDMLNKPSSSELSSGDSAKSPGLHVFDPEKAMQEQNRMMEMTMKLMQDHERMMKATAEIMNEHKRLKQELEETKQTAILPVASKQAATNAMVQMEQNAPSQTLDEPSIEKSKVAHANSEVTRVTEEGSDSSNEATQPS